MINPTALRNVFDQAASLPPVERAAFLERVCGANIELRCEVERCWPLTQDAGRCSIGRWLAPAIVPRIDRLTGGGETLQTCPWNPVRAL
jgi:hypothetical protein